MNTLDISALSIGFKFDSPLANDVNLNTISEQIVHLKGRNGSGKSTFLRTIAGHVRPLGGSVSVMGAPPNSRTARRSRWLMTSSAPHYGYLTVQEQAQFYASMAKTYVRETHIKLDQLGLSGSMDTLCKDLSSGQGQKLWFATSLVGNNSKVLLLDEPFNAVDAESVPDMIKMIQDAASGGRTILIASHIYGDLLGSLPNYSQLELSSGRT